MAARRLNTAGPGLGGNCNKCRVHMHINTYAATLNVSCDLCMGQKCGWHINGQQTSGSQGAW